MEASLATDGVQVSLCDTTWMSELAADAEDLFGGYSFELSEPAMEGTLVVSVNGVVTKDYTYSAAGNTVSFTSTALSDGDTVEITYQIAGCG